MKRILYIWIICTVSTFSAKFAVSAAEKQHTYEFGACEQQLMWRDKGKLDAQLEHLDAMKKAGCGWVRLSLIYPTNLDKNLFAILQHCNELDIKVLMVIEQGRPQLYPGGTKRRPGSDPPGQPAWSCYRLSEMDLKKAEVHLQNSLRRSRPGRSEFMHSSFSTRSTGSLSTATCRSLKAGS